MEQTQVCRLNHFYKNEIQTIRWNRFEIRFNGNMILKGRFLNAQNRDPLQFLIIAFHRAQSKVSINIAQWKAPLPF